MADSVKSTSDSTKHGMIVLNPDGSSVGGGGVYSSTPPTYTDGQTVVAQYDANGNQKVTLASLIAGEDLTTNKLSVEQRASYTVPITADTLIKTGSGRWFGFIVNSHTSGTLKVWDNTSAATTVLCDTITFAAGPQFWVFPVGIEFTTGLYFDVGGTISVTPLYK